MNKDNLKIGGVVIGLITGVLALVILVSLLVGLNINKGSTPTVVNNNLPEQKLGSTPGSDFDGPCISVNGVMECSYSSGMNKASTTVCSFKSPAATTTLQVATANFTTGSTSALQFEWAKGNTPTATTTSLGVDILPANKLGTMLASTSPIMFATGSQGLMDTDTPIVIAPKQYINLKYSNGTAACTSACNALVGTCKVKLIIN